MNGRLENELRIFKQIEQKIDNMPDSVIEWYYYLKANGQSAMTCRDYVRKIDHFFNWVKKETGLFDVDVETITDKIIIKYFVSIQTRFKGGVGEIVECETSDSYRQCVWSCLNNYFTYLCKKGKIETNYLVDAGIDRPKNNDLDRIKSNRLHTTADDFKNILEITYEVKYNRNKYINRDRAMLMLLMATGMRESALRSINVEDIDFINRTIMVIDKGKKRHMYYLDDKLVDILELWIYTRNEILTDPKSSALFISKSNERISVNGIVKMVKKYTKAALGYEMSPHKFRSGLASILYEQKNDVEYVRRVIGHSNISTTQRYIVTNNKEREEATNMITSMVM